MSVREEFDAWAAAGRDRGMERRHWHTAKEILSRMPLENGDTVLDLGCGSGYAARALREAGGAGRAYGVDGSPAMVENASSYTNDDRIGYLVGDFEHLPFAADSVDHCFSMEAFYYARSPEATLQELDRVIRSGGTFYCGVNYYEENVHSHSWGSDMELELTRWDAERYRRAFREAGFHVAEQDNIPDRKTEIPPEEEFPTENWERREEMVERYREYGTLLTVGVVP